MDINVKRMFVHITLVYRRLLNLVTCLYHFFKCRNADIVSLWRVGCSPSMLAIHFAFTTGGIISYFVAQQFLPGKVYTIFTNMTAQASLMNKSDNDSVKERFG